MKIMDHTKVLMKSPRAWLGASLLGLVASHAWMAPMGTISAASAATATASPVATATTQDGGTSVPVPTVVETNAAPVLDFVVPGAPAGVFVRATRVDSSGRRSIELISGGVASTLVSGAETGVLSTDVRSFYVAGTTLVCADLFKAGTTVTWRCGVRVPGGSSFANVVELPAAPHAFLHDVCLNKAGNTFTLLFRKDSGLIGTSEAAVSGDVAALFESLVWRSSSTGFMPGSQRGASSCDELDGMPCSDPCYLGAGVYSSGTCNTAGLPPACTASPGTEVLCTGDPDNLCITYTPE